ncbi:MAG: hypothetical protein AAGH17_03510 [Pseudomonadota bacterium]
MATHDPYSMRLYELPCLRFLSTIDGRFGNVASRAQEPQGLEAWAQFQTA